MGRKDVGSVMFNVGYRGASFRVYADYVLTQHGDVFDVKFIRVIENGINKSELGVLALPDDFVDVATARVVKMLEGR